MKYLGRYGNPIREQLGANFFEYIKKTKFSDDLIKEKITINKDFESSWIIDKEYKNKYKDLSFILDNKKDIIITSTKSITIFDLLSYREKTLFNIPIVDNINIISIIKLKNNRILFSTSDNCIQLIDLSDDNKNIEIFKKQLNYCAQNFLYLEKEKNIEKNNGKDLNVDKVIFTTNYNLIYCLNDINNSIPELLINENNKIILLKKYFNNNILYLTEGQNNDTYVNFLDLKNKEKNIKILTINQKSTNLVNVAILNDYCLIGFENSIYLINNQNELKTSFLLNEKLTDLISFKTDEILIGIYNKEKDVSFLREIIIEYENDKYNPYMIGEGKINDESIKKIIELNSNYILINTEKGSLLKLEKKSKANEIFQESYNKYRNKKLKSKKKEFDVFTVEKISFKSERNNIYNTKNIQRTNFTMEKSFELDVALNNYKDSHKELNSNYLNLIEKNKQTNNCYNNKEENIIYQSSNIHNNNMNKNANKINPIKINKFEEKINEINLKEKEDESIGKSLLFFFPEANKTTLTINFVKYKDINS